jgi:hypothetical protein
MTRGPEVLTFGATAGCVMLVTGTALALIIWAAFTFVDLVPATALTSQLQFLR